MVNETANVLRKRRHKIGARKNDLSEASYLRRFARHRAEASDRIPSLAFRIDWADTLGTSCEKVAAETRKSKALRHHSPASRRSICPKHGENYRERRINRSKSKLSMPWGIEATTAFLAAA